MNQEIAEQLLSSIEQTVTSLFYRYQLPYLVYHNLSHTQTVVKHTFEIAAHYPLNYEEKFILFAAAWFHDTGQLFSSPEQHEQESIKTANDFFQGNQLVPAYLLTAIDDCILATKMPQSPGSLIEEILCDADLYHLGTDAFWHIDALVKQEAMQRGINADNWNEKTLKMLQTHKYHTAYCREKLDTVKAENIALLINKTGEA